MTPETVNSLGCLEQLSADELALALESNVPNLDAMDWSDPQTFWSTHNRGQNRGELFPAGGKGTVKATQILACYAMEKSCAIALRLKGEIARAQSYEHAAQLAYDRLPEWARW